MLPFFAQADQLGLYRFTLAPGARHLNLSAQALNGDDFGAVTMLALGLIRLGASISTMCGLAIKSWRPSHEAVSYIPLSASTLSSSYSSQPAS